MFSKRIVFILFLVAILIGTMSSLSAEDSSEILNATDDIGIAADEDNDGSILEITDSNSEDDILESSKAGTFTELQSKIDNAKKGSTIYLTKDYKYDKGFSTNGIKITKSLTIDGKGHSINGLEKSALLTIYKANSVVLKNIVFEDGFFKGIGAVSILNSNNVKFSNCRFLDNSADYGAAVFLAYSNHSSFVGCKFSQCSAEYLGGAVYLAYCEHSSFDSCKFDYNFAEYGGAVYSTCSSSSFDSCSFLDNTNFYGGPVYLDYSSSSFDSCNFVDNWAFYDGGGAIYSFNSVLNCLNTKFKSNRAFNGGGGDIQSHYSMIFLQDSSFYGSYSEGFGASLSFDNDYAQINGCTFEKGYSYNDGGGAIYCLNSVVTTVSSQFKDCFAFWGGAICSVNTDLVIHNNTFYNDTAGYTGGSIYSIYGSISVDSSVFTYSSAQLGGVMYIRSPHIINNITNNMFLYSSAQICPKIYVDEFYGEIPESGNIYEDVYFVVGNFTHDLDDEVDYYIEEDEMYSVNDYSNVLTYIFSNSKEYRNDFHFYNDLESLFFSNVDIDLDDGVFHIFDEYCPDNSTILLNNDGSNVVYDVGHFYNEFKLLNRLELYIYNIKGFKLDYLQVAPNFSNNGNLSQIFYLSHAYSKNGIIICPIGDGEKNITLFGKYPNNQYAWFSDNLDKSYDYKINGTFSFNFTEKGICYNSGNVYEYRASILPVPLFNPDYDGADEVLEDFYLGSRYQSSVKDQGIGGNCWAFAGIATLEACLNKITGEDYDFSENNAKNLMAASSIYGLNIDSNAGGYDSMFIGYLASWLGPIDEKYDMYNPLSSISQDVYSMFHIQDISFLSPRKNYLDNDEFKYAIKNYGAVAVIFNWTGLGFSGFHAVSLVGWDDNFEGFDSLGNYAKGAWIFKNSWGENWKDNWSSEGDGFGYLSYRQDLSGEIAPYMHAYTFIFNDSDVGYQDIYQYDFAGFTDYLCADNDVYYKNRFTAKSNEYLYAFSTYFEKPTYFTFSVRINGKDITKTDDNETIVSSMHYSPAGYHTISLGYNLTLNEGDEFEIVIKLVNDGINFIPVCQADELYKYSYTSNVSFMSYNGEDWIDLYNLQSSNRFAYGGNKSNTCQIACIKAFTATWRAGSLDDYYAYSNASVHNEIYEILNIDYSLYYAGLDTLIIINVLDWDYNNYENYENYVELTVNGEIHYLKFSEGSAFFILKNEFDYYSCSAKLKSNCFGSNLLLFDFIVGEEENFGTFSELEKIIDSAEDGDQIILNKNYYFDSNFNKSSILINKSLVINGSGHIFNGVSKSGFFNVDSNCTLTLINIEFRNGNSAGFGAISSKGDLIISGCTFSNNKADLGGAIYCEGDCFIRASMFNGNSANLGGAVFASGYCYISLSQFDYNHADTGGAVYCNGECNLLGDSFDHNHADFGGAIAGLSDLYVSECDFTYNSALFSGGTIFSRNVLNIADSNFKSNLDVDTVHFTYYHDDIGIYGDLCLKNNTMVTRPNVAAIYYDEDKMPYNSSMHLVFTNEYAIKGDYVYVCQLENDDGNTFRMGDVNLTLTNRNDLSKAINLNVKYDSDWGGYVLNTSLIDCGCYLLDGSISEDYSTNCTVKQGLLYVVDKLVLDSSNLAGVYGKVNDLTVTLKDGNGNIVSDTYIAVVLGGKVYKLKTNSKGQASVAVNMVPKKYVATVGYAGNGPEFNTIINVNVVVKKATPKITAKKKTFKVKTKVKKYTITLKNNLGKAMKNVKVTIKIKGKTYTAKTNSKGKATFKIKNLGKKGKFKATVKYAGSKYYNSVSKKITITVK